MVGVQDEQPYCIDDEGNDKFGKEEDVPKVEQSKLSAEVHERHEDVKQQHYNSSHEEATAEALV